MRYRTIGSDAATQRSVSVLSLGAMLMGSRTDEATSFAILDRFVEAGGTFIDTSGNYAFWVHGTQGGESEELLGRWRRSRGIGDEIVIATKVGARPLAPAADFVRSDGSLIEMDGLSAKAIRESAERSMARLGCRAAGPDVRAHLGSCCALVRDRRGVRRAGCPPVSSGCSG